MNAHAATALVFDHGARRIGVAFANQATGTTSPVAMLRARSGVPDWREVDTLVAQWRPSLLLVGWPLNMDGSEGVQCPGAAAFAQALRQRAGREVLLVDERLSSREARGRVHAAREARGGRSRVAHDDADYQAMSAVVIAESWLTAGTEPRPLPAAQDPPR